MTLHAFPPIIGENPKVLILGSMPSVKSLEKSHYYGHPNNHFWKIMGALFSFDPKAPYAYRTAILQDNGIAIWDVIASCERQGSLDSNIRNPKYHDVPGLINHYPTITHVVLNGGKAKDVYQKTFAPHLPHITAHPFFSTSTASRIPYERKFAQWQAIITFLGNTD